MILKTALLLAAAAMSTNAWAADLDQQYYMREKLTLTSSPSQAPATPSQASWTTGEWSEWSSTCSASAARTRSVTCTSDGSVVADAKCTGGKPESTETGNDSSCAYEWHEKTSGSSDMVCASGSVQMTTTSSCMSKTNIGYNSDAGASNCSTFPKPAARTFTVACQALGKGYTSAWSSGNTGTPLWVKTFPSKIAKTDVQNAALAMCSEQVAAYPAITGDCFLRFYYENDATGESAIMASAFGAQSNYPTTAPAGFKAIYSYGLATRLKVLTNQVTSVIPPEILVNPANCPRITVSPDSYRTCS
jgi:hypothetical protein